MGDRQKSVTILEPKSRRHRWGDSALGRRVALTAPPGSCAAGPDQEIQGKKAADMQKGLCIAALSISGLVLLLFLADILMWLGSMQAFAPYKGFNVWSDLVFIVCAAIIGWLSWTNYRKLP